ncbi:MAG: SurA N-terminal domain-containing protein [Lysobacter spongiicola]|nr:SurA N-terminal domain-containing protein [Lysobacter spongiicola]
MLQNLRDKTTGWVATVIIGLMIIPFAFFGLDQYMVQRSDTTVANIKAPPTWWSSAPSFWPVSVLWRHEEVTVDEFRNRFEQVRQQRRAEQADAFDNEAFQSRETKLEVLDTLIDQQVQAMAAEQAGIVVSDAMVRNAIQQVPAFQLEGRFDPQRYQLALASQNQTPAQFEQIIRDSLQQSLVAAAVAGSNFVTTSELDRLIRLMGERRDATVLLVPPPEQAEPVSVTDEQVQAWYEAHAAEYRAPETVTIEYFELTADSLPAPPVDEQALRERYEEQRSQMGEQEERLASHILVEVADDADEAAWDAAREEAAQLAERARTASTDFSALAAEHSDDPGSRNSGGDLGWIGRGMMPGEFEEALFGMEQGEVSAPVRTDFGWHVVQLRDVRTGGEMASFEELRDTLALEQAEADREESFSEVAGQVVDAVLSDPNTLQTAAEVAGAEIRRLGPFSRESAEGLAAQPEILREAFSSTRIEDRTASDPIEVAPRHHVWIRVVEHTPESARPLEQVREEVVAAVRADLARKAAAERVEALVKRLEAGETLEALAEAESLPAPQSIPGIPRGAPLVAEGVSEAIFATRIDGEGGRGIGHEVLEDGRAVVFTVDKVVPGDTAEVPPEQREVLYQQLAQIGGAEDLQEMTARLRKQVEVEVVEENL